MASWLAECGFSSFTASAAIHHVTLYHSLYCTTKRYYKIWHYNCTCRINNESRSRAFCFSPRKWKWEKMQKVDQLNGNASDRRRIPYLLMPWYVSVRKVSNSNFPRRIRTRRQSPAATWGPNPRAPPRCRSSFWQSDQQLTSAEPLKRVHLKQHQMKNRINFRNHIIT